MREEQWESERQQTTHGLKASPTDLNKHEGIHNGINKTNSLLVNSIE